MNMTPITPHNQEFVFAEIVDSLGVPALPVAITDVTVNIIPVASGFIPNVNGPENQKSKCRNVT